MSQPDNANRMSELSASLTELSPPHREYIQGIVQALLFAQKNDSDGTYLPKDDKEKKESVG